jgi:hypothetical protein
MVRVKVMVFIFFSFNLSAQRLHHQMISSQGSNSKLKNGMLVNQSIGQLSSTGNYISSKISMSQGYIQSQSSVKGMTHNINSISTIVYPNPFSDILNFGFSTEIEKNVRITIFDVRGRLIYSNELKPIGNLLTVKSLNFAGGTYFVKLEGKDLNYSSQIIKIK